MIRPLRQRHRRMVIALGILLPIAFAAGVIARKPVPGMASFPVGLLPLQPKFTNIEWQRADLFTNAMIQVTLLRASANTGDFAVQFSAPRDFLKPDLIVYWAVGKLNITNALPDNVRLLGGFDTSRTLPLPADAATGDGALILYSLADQELVGVSKPFTPGKP